MSTSDKFFLINNLYKNVFLPNTIIHMYVLVYNCVLKTNVRFLPNKTLCNYMHINIVSDPDKFHEIALVS